MIIWTFFQILVFVCLLVAFYSSTNNYFMRDYDTCYATDVLTRANNDLPLKECANKACLFHNYTVFSGSIWGMNDDRPRDPRDGAKSMVFEYDQQWWCCNYDATSTECKSKLPYGAACGAIMWVAGFSAVCAMLMTQVTLQGFYSFCSRRSALWTVISVIGGIFLRLTIFVTLFYFFFGFMFAFIFFWIPMLLCDNPYAFQWWKFGYLYVYYFFENFAWIISNGFTKWDGNMDFDTMIATHSSLAMMIDFLFALVYIALSKIKDHKGQPYCHLTFFKL